MAQGATGERYLLGADNLSWAAIFETIADAFDADPPRRSIPDWLIRSGAALTEAAAFVTRTAPWFPRSAARSLTTVRRYDNTKAAEELGCSFRPFADTMERIALALAE
jgi:dihydroflavonol-4-reductase